MSDYINSRWHDPIFFPPKDRVVLDTIEPCFELPGEFIGYPTFCNPAWGSYSLSAAALFSPQVFAANDDGEFWSAPWEMPAGYRVPSFSQVKYPTLKTHMLEHHWLQNTKAPCNPSFLGCEPYYFHHSFQSVPVTLFYDGSVRMMGVLEAMSSDRRATRQIPNVTGLWSRDTPFWDEGYLTTAGSDPPRTGLDLLPTAVRRRGLYPQILEGTFAQQPPVPNAVERHSTREAQILEAGFSVNGPSHAQHDLFADLLYRSGEVHLSLREFRLRNPRRSAEKLIERPVGHGEASEVVEIFLVEREGAVFLEIDQLAQDEVDILRLAVRRKAQDLVFAGVDLEPRELREGTVQQGEC